MFLNLHSVVRKISRLGVFILCVLLMCGLARSVTEAQLVQTYDNDGNWYYSDNVAPGLPTGIQATNFYNDSVFSITYATFKSKTSVYFKIQDTVNYTNDVNGLITVNSPINTNALFISTYNVGFEFDDYRPSLNSDTLSGTFDNEGTIRCDSVLDGNNFIIADGFQLYEITSAGNCLIQATNIIDPGDIDVSVDGSITMTGQNVDLSGSLLNVENIAQLLGTEEVFGTTIFNNVNFNSTGLVGLDTNKDFYPAVDLAPNFARNSDIIYPIEPYAMFLSNSLSYFKTDGLGTSNVIYRCVFVENNSPNAPDSVFIDPTNVIDELAFEAGAAHVQWAGYFTDPATGVTTTNYLYLTDDYIWGASTNVLVLGGVPDNFTFVSSTTPLFPPTAAIAPGFDFTVPFDANYITNRYAYMNGQITATSVQTNNIGGLPLEPSRIVITGNNHLNLTDAIIGGENYLSLTATNQFDGSGGAQIASPYSDLNLGSTNGFMTITNLLEAGIPNWSGIIQAWSTRWVDVNGGMTNDFRVLFVNSRLQPTLSPWVNNLTLHATNSLYVNDVLNVFGTLFFDARSLTLATNTIGVGATSFDGELNAFFPGNMGPALWPNLLYVTNNGAIRGQNEIIFTNSRNCGAVINNSLIADQGTIIYATNFVSGGIISNGVGNFTVRAQTATLTNGLVTAGGSISITGGSLLASNVPMQCLSLTLSPTNYLSDGGPGSNNDNIWTVGYTNATGGGLSLLYNPGNGDLLGTTITNICPGPNKIITDTWAGKDFGVSSSGYRNNSALGHLILDVEGVQSLIKFGGAGSSNALYVDALEVRGVLTNGVNAAYISGGSGISYDFSKYLAINTNLVIYFAQAYWNGYSIAEAIENASLEGGNGGNTNLQVLSTNLYGLVTTNVVVVPGRLRWVPGYAGYFSSTNIVVAGVTNAVNAALAESGDIDSNGSGVNGYPTYNNSDPATHFFEPQELNFALTLTNQPSRRLVLTWNTIPFATNYVYYTSSLLTNNWTLFTNFTSTSGFGPAYPVTVSDTNLTQGIRFYQVKLQPLSADSWLLNPPQ